GGTEREAGRSSARITDEVEALETGGVGHPRDAADLGLQCVVRGWRVRRVDLELLRPRVDVVAEHIEEGGICELGGKNTAGQKDGLKPLFAHEPIYIEPGRPCRAGPSSNRSAPVQCRGDGALEPR